MESPASQLSRQIRSALTDAGFSKIGIAPAVSPTGFHKLVEWLAAGYAADMNWMEHRLEAYRHPDGVMQGVGSVIMAAMNYHRPENSEEASADTSPRIASYTFGATDYHDFLKKRMRPTANLIRSVNPHEKSRIVVDTAPLLERDFARLAGIGWFGKNTMLINRQVGSWFLLGAILTTAVLEYDAPFESDHCGTCTRCLDACPTDAFPSAGVLDAGKCISYQTIENRTSDIPEHLRTSLGPWLFGCDICQDVCPWNRFAPECDDPELYTNRHLQELSCLDVLMLDEDGFRTAFLGTAMFRTGRPAVVRNAAIVAANLNLMHCVDQLKALLADPELMVREAASWALNKLQPSAKSS
ncbi:MAG: tRNA epoxyqueuosine(34) reductase QueG [Planctomycetaceae bacterium]